MTGASPDRVRLLLIRPVADLARRVFDEGVHAFLCGFHVKLQAKNRLSNRKSLVWRHLRRCEPFGLCREIRMFRRASERP